MADSEVALTVKNVSKIFRLPHERHNGLKGALISATGGGYRRGFESHVVLRDVSFQVKKGEFFGIVGRNGSGKSTLLKLISGIYEPNGGKVIVNGSLTPFIELGVGFNPELTGLENVYLNGALLGFSRAEMDAKLDDIIEFSELEEFMDQKLKNYSSGMQVRLAFSIAIQSDSDILILDEVLAVGDEAFQRKCNDFFQKIKEDRSKTIVLVTHSMGSVKRYCDRALLIKDGVVVTDGSPDDVANEYSLENLEQKKVKKEESKKDSVIKDFGIELIGAKRIDQATTIKIKTSYTPLKKCTTNTLVFLNDDNRKCYLIGGRSETKNHKANEAVEELVSFQLPQLNDTTIRVGAEVWDDSGNIVAYVAHEECPLFMLRRTDYTDDFENKSILFGHGYWENEA